MDYSKFKLFEGNFWDVFLNTDQTAIGRFYFWYKGDSLDLLEVSKEAIIEFYNICKKVKSALNNLFEPDLYNYLSLNNQTKHLHLHVIPRYSKKVEFSGITFEDKNFGKPYEKDSNFVLDEDLLLKLAEKIKFLVKNQK